MVWFRVDDSLPTHHRVIAAGNAAMGLWVRCGAWSMGQLTDGFIPDAVARMFGTEDEAAALVASGLWVEADGGYQFHRWAADGSGAPRQPTRAEIEDKRKADRERKAQHAANARAALERRKTAENPSGVATDSGRIPSGIPTDSASRSVYPDPTRPVPSLQDQEKRSSDEDLLFDETADAAPSNPPASQEIALIETPKAPARKSSGRYPQPFEAWWAVYPRHEGKRNALAAWERACRRADPRTVMDGAIRYRDDPNREPAYTAHPTTWLNRDGWDDAPLPKRRPDSQQDRLEQNSRDTLATLHRMGVA